MKAEIILGAYIGLQKIVIKVEEAVKQSVRDVIASIDKKVLKVDAKVVANSRKFDIEMDKVSQKFIDRGIKTSTEKGKLQQRKSELQGLL